MAIHTDITPFTLITLVVYIVLGIAVNKKHFVSPMFDFECNFLMNVIPLVLLYHRFENMSI